MKTYKLTYGRKVYLERYIEAESEEEALDKAWQLEQEQELGIAEIKAKPGSEITDIWDNEYVWEVEEEWQG